MIPNFKCDFCNGLDYAENPRTDRRLGLSSDRFKLVECKRCGLTALFPHPTEEELHSFYKNYASQKNRIHDELSRMENIYPDKLKTIRRLTNGRQLLDIGAGLGAFCHMAQKQGFDVTGVELSEEQCRYARDHFGLELVNQDIFSAGKDFGPYDIIHLHHVMEHLTSPDRAFDRIRQLLRPGGILLIEVPSQLPRLQERFRKQVRKTLAFNFDHLYFFTPRTMKQYILKHGFKIKAFRQHRSMARQSGSLHLRAAKYLFRNITSALYLPSGPFLEFYCQKESD